MAQNQLTKRLIAAGASPQKAQQFSAMAARKAFRPLTIKPMAEPSIIRPMAEDDTTEGSDVNPATPPRVDPIQEPGIREGTTAEIIFDKEIGAISQAKYPNTWRPFVVDSQEADDYIRFTAGSKTIQQLKDNAFNQIAPNYIKLKNTPIPVNPVTKKVDPLKYTLAQTIIASLDNDVAREQLIEYVSGQATSNPGSLGGLKLVEATKLINDLYNEYDLAQKQYAKNKVDFLNSDKYYSSGIPHPKLRYGASTNYKMGTIDIATEPGVKEYYDAMNELYKKDYAGSSAAGGIAVQKVLKKNIDKTPFVNEAIRRQDLAKAAIVRK
jgi:hypothetical protein